MSTRKILRELKRALDEDGIQFSYTMDRSGHPKLLVTHVDGRIQRCTCASSPHDDTECVKYMLRIIRGFAKASP